VTFHDLLRSPRARVVCALVLAGGAALGGCRDALGIDANQATVGDGGADAQNAEAADGATSGANDGSINDPGMDGGGGNGDGGAGGGTVCTATTCPPVTFQKNLYGPVALAVNATHVYWIEVGTTIPQADMFGQLNRLPKSTTCAARSCYDILDPLVLSGELEGQEIYDTHIALGINDVCYTQSFNANPEHQISCFGLTTGLTKRSIDQAAGDVTDLFIDAINARWVITSSNTGVYDGIVQGAALQASATTTLASNRPSPWSVTSDGTHVFWTEIGSGPPNGTIETLSPTAMDGGIEAGVSLFTGRSNPVSVRAYGGYLYWIEQSARTVMRAPSNGSGMPEQIATTDENPFDLEVDASGVYWASAGTGNNALYGSVAHAPLTPGGTITTMMDNIDKVSQIALDSTSVWIASTGTNLDAGLIVRMDKTH
jgi:hypothetical protein